MCGIWAYLIKNKDKLDYYNINKNFNNIKKRGPNYSSLIYENNDFYEYYIGFHRLSINDLSLKGNQPFVKVIDNIKYVCVCNGEIYNFKKILENNIPEYESVSNSDCEVLIPLWIKYKYEMVNYLDGVFAFIILTIDQNNNLFDCFVGRDRIGVRPLYKGIDKYGNYVLSSEMKGLNDLCENGEQFEPGTIEDLFKSKIIKYYNLDNIIIKNLNESEILGNINKILTECVEKRLLSDVPVCALLSGGLDSSLICSIISKILKKNGKGKLHTFSIGMQGSPDNYYAEMVSKYIDSKHTIINISEEEALNSINDVIWNIETYDITTIRASVGQYLVTKYISDNTNFKVVLSGDGSDEVCNGYLENYFASNENEIQENAIDRVKNIHFYDVLRADRATSCNGLELRVPFLDVNFVNYYLEINPNLKFPKKNVRCEKYLLRKAFENNYLPEEVLWRQKEAFSDGISEKENSWYKIIQNNCENKYSDNDLLNNKYIINKPISKESLYFREKFEEFYGNKNNKIIPKFWMPKWSNTNDPSARCLKIN